MYFPSPRLLRSLLIFSYALLLIPLAPHLAHAQAPSPPPTRKAPPPPPPPPATGQQQFISYWTTETGWQTQLELRNNQTAQNLTVTPVLRAMDGAETALFPVLIQPQEVKTIDIATAIGNSAPQLIGAYGSILLRYTATAESNLYAVAMVMGIGHSLAFHIDATDEDVTENTGSREGIWWLPNAAASDYLVLTNQGQNPLQASLTVYDATGKASVQAISLGPRAMLRYSIREVISAAKLAGAYGGIKISAASHAGSLDTLHVVFDSNGGFSAVMKMFDYDPRAQLKERDYAGTGKWTLRAPMLALSNPDPSLAFPQGMVLQPQLFIRNITTKPVDAALAFTWRTDTATGKAAGPELHLAPSETRRIDVAALQDGKTLPQNAQWASVSLTTNSLPGEVVAVAASYDKTLRYGAQTPFSDQLAFHWAGSQWQYDPLHDSIITVGNGGTKPTQAALTLFYNQGTQKYQLEQKLQPEEQMWIDLGKLIRENLPDKNGKTLPADLTSGSYEIRDLTNTGVGTLFEGKIVYDKTYGHVTYGCGSCCGYKGGLKFWYNPLGIPLLGTSDNGATCLDTCAGQYEDVSGDLYGSWDTANHAIATVDTYGTHTGQSVGSTTSSAHTFLQAASLKTVCPDDYFGGSPGDNTIPVISGPNTLWWFNGLGSGVSGYSNQITLTASSGGNGTTYQWAITAGSSKVSLSTSTSATVQVTSIGQSTSANDVGVTVTVGGQTSNPFTITVRAPYALGTDPNHPTPTYAQDSTFVWNISIPYLILDNLLTPMPNPVSINESWTTDVVPDYSGENWEQSIAGCATTISGAAASFSDFIQGDLPDRTPTPVYNVNQNGPAVLHWGQDWRVGTCTNGVGPRVQKDTLQKYTDHAAHTGITSPAP